MSFRIGARQPLGDTQAGASLAPPQARTLPEVLPDGALRVRPKEAEGHIARSPSPHFLSDGSHEIHATGGTQWCAPRALATHPIRLDVH